MKKLFTILLSSSLLASCAKKEATTKTEATAKTETKTDGKVIKASDKFMIFGEPEKFAYATQYGSLEESSPETNLIARQLYKSAIRYNYTLPGWPETSEGIDAAEVFTNTTAQNYYNVKWTLGDNSKKSDEVAAKILERWEAGGINVGFIQTNPETKEEIINGQKLQDAIKNKVYTGKLVLTGKNTKHVDLYGDNKGGAWSDYSNVATFEFSQIITAFNAGYLTQTQFGRFKNSEGNWEKRTVGYIVAAQKKDGKKWNVLQMKKANAFRKGVLAAVNEQKTGEAKFVKKESASDNSSEKTLMFESTDITKYFSVLKKEKDYTENDHSFVYYAGADAEINDLVATELLNSEVSNKYGHKMVIETAGADDSDNIRSFGEGESAAWSKGNGNKQSVSGRVFMAVKPWINAKTASSSSSDPEAIDTTWLTAEKAANLYAVEAVISSLYGENQGKIDYFGKHTYIGSFPEFSRVGTHDINDKAHKIDDDLLDKVRHTLYLKNEDISKITDEFLGSGI